MKRASIGLLGIALLASCAGPPPDPGPNVPGPPPALSASTQTDLSIDPPKLRLPGDAAPVRYEVEMTLDPALPTFSGSVAVQLEARRAVRVVWLHAQGLMIKSASFTRGGGAAASTAAVRVLDGKEPFAGFVLPDEMSPESGGVLKIDYEGKIDGDKPQGVYAVSEGAGADDRYVYSLFEPLDARRAFPCFDEPEYKVPWKLSLRVRKGHGAYSNAEAARETEDGGMKRIDFAETPPMPSYLVAFMAGPFDVVDAGTAGREKKKLRFIVPKGRGAETRYAAKITPAIIAQLEDYFGMAYPYSKLDVAVVPRYEGTMEHPGIVALGQPLTLIPPGEEALARKQAYTNIAAHELAHYWFGDYVTMRWWDDTWLNEGFAQWMDAKLTDAVEPTWGALRSMRLDRAAMAMSADRLATAKKMRQPVESPEDILNAFDAGLTYQKGASVITMMEHAVGPEKWKEALRRYMQRLAWKTAASSDLMAVISEVAGPEAAAAFQTFLDQPGLPLVKVAPACGGPAPKLLLEQQRFLPLGTKAEGGLWNVPVCVRYGAGAEKGRMCTYLGTKSKEVPLPDMKVCPEWVVPNEEATGYYVSLYSGNDIDRLRGKGKAPLGVEERAALVRDVGLLVSSGAIPLGKAMELVPDAVASGDKTTLEAVQSILRNARGADLPEPLHAKLQSFVRKTFTPRAKALGFSPKPDESPDVVEMRAMLLTAAGLGGEDPEILKTAKRLALKWLDDRKSVPPDLAGVVLPLAVHTNDKALFDKLSAMAKSEPDRTAKGLLFEALGHVSDRALAERALGMALAKENDLRETFPLVGTLLHGRETRELAYDFLKKSFDTLMERTSAFERPILFKLPGVFCDAAHRADVEAFFGPRAKTVDGAERVLKNTLESIQLCEASHKAALPSLEDFLKKH